MRNIILYLLLSLGVTGFTQDVDFFELKYSIKNLDKYKEVIFIENTNFDENLTPIFTKTYFDGNYSLQIIDPNYNLCNTYEKKLLTNIQLPSKIYHKEYNSVTKGKHSTSIEINPFVKINGEIKKLTSFKIKYQKVNTPGFTFRKNEAVLNSKLANNSWYKFAIPNKGMYKISFEYLSDLNLINGSLASNSIQLIGNNAKMLPFINQDLRMDDLEEISIEVIDGNDGVFNEGDYIVFYGMANGIDFYDSTNDLLKKEINLYSDTNFVFLNFNSLNGKRILHNPYSTSSVDSIYNYSKMTHHELENVNFIKSGKNWIGEQFIDSELDFKINYNAPFNEPRKITSSYKVCARSSSYTDNIVSFIVNKDTISEVQLNKVSSIYYNDYVKFASNQSVDTLTKDSLNISFFYKQSNNPNVWLDYFIINTRERLHYSNQFSFIETINDNSIHTFSIQSDENIKVWDITNFNNTSSFDITSNTNSFYFSTNLDTIKEFIVFSDKDIQQPIFKERISPQNLHSATPSNYIIITEQKFEKQAKRLIDLHQFKDNLSGQIYFTNQIYNEYSSGRPEATAIRDFIRSLYFKGQNTSDSVQYVLLIGDGSYDPKNRLINNHNIIPTFQSDNSVKLTSSYVTDDIYGLLDDHEGQYNAGDQLDISIGRFPVYYEVEAKNIVDKIYEYYNEYDKSNTFNSIESDLLTSNGSWKNNILFIADDEDNNEHMKQADKLAELVDTTINELNIKKLLLDSYAQESSISGHTSPEANKSLIEHLHNGVLLLNYTGHGGELGWTEEQLLQIDDITSSQNRHTLPLLMTATCEFSRFDNPVHKSAGEYLILQKQGGAIALFTTVRLVFSLPNFKLNKTFYKILKESINNSETRLGDVFRLTKVINNGGTNDRNFTLLGDPALKLAFPLFNVKIDSIQKNGISLDTLKSLSTPTMHGHIENKTGILQSNYNGWAEVKIFDKKRNTITLDNDNNGIVFNYNSQEDLLFKGQTKIENGIWKIDFIIPKDIRLNYDFGKISVYAVDSNGNDATGYSKDYKIGGTSNDYTLDDKGPVLSVFLDDTTFTFGDEVTPTPLFISRLSDSSGINIMNNDIGKDITLTIDEDYENTIVLNSKYKTSKQTYKSGEIIVPLDELENGRHSLKLKAFDNQNNSSQAYTEFYIESNPEIALEHVLNYPNPFTTNTDFYFEHNQSSNDLEIMIQIITISGKIVKTITSNQPANSKRIGPINWDGKDDFGDNIGRGVYVYRIIVQNSKGDKTEQLEKLVILK